MDDQPVAGVGFDAAGKRVGGGYCDVEGLGRVVFFVEDGGTVAGDCGEPDESGDGGECGDCCQADPVGAAPL